MLHRGQKDPRPSTGTARPLIKGKQRQESGECEPLTPRLGGKSRRHGRMAGGVAKVAAENEAEKGCGVEEGQLGQSR